MNGLQQVFKIGWNIVNSVSSSAANKFQSCSNSYKYIMDLTTNGVVITDAIKFVQTNTMSNKEEDNGNESKELDYGEDQ